LSGVFGPRRVRYTDADGVRYLEESFANRQEDDPRVRSREGRGSTAPPTIAGVTGSLTRVRPPRRRRRHWGSKILRAFLILLAVAVGAVAAVAAGVVWWSGVTLAGDSSELARVELQPLAGSLVSAKAYGRDGATIPVAVEHGRLVPKAVLDPGVRVRVEVVVRRPGWLGWAVGRTRHEQLTVETPVARVTNRWLTLRHGASLRVRFAAGVDRIAYRGRTIAADGRHVVLLGRQRPAGTVVVSAAARPWERLGAPLRLSWFPPASHSAVLVSPTPGTTISPLATIRLTFQKPVAAVFGSAAARFSTRVSGRWLTVDSHTLLFRPRPFGFPFSSKLHLALPHAVGVTAGNKTAPARAIDWTVASGSLMRLHQLLAQQGYLPLDWQPAGEAVAKTARAEVDAAVTPPAGRFGWRYPNTPSQLTSQWNPTVVTQITRGAVMMFEDEHGLTVDGLAGPHVWRALITDAIAGKRHTAGYSYVYVHTRLPQLLTLWHNGHVVLTSPGNTGIPSAPTQPGTYPVFEHIPVGTMSGTNPNGSHYHDPGIRWISYFHGGDALHAFTRASFGTPQSLGCVELPLAAAAKTWPYTPIGTLVTIENA
jgi:peptidoglycan hydrolase-like protein with peptidoglycan-binding domain